MQPNNQRSGYFNYLGAMGMYGGMTLHTGGLSTTVELIDRSGIKPGAKVLEIGCGTGVTSSLLMQARFLVSIVEPSDAMRFSCMKNIEPLQAYMQPIFYSAPLEEVVLPDNYFDFCLMEAVFGFLTDKHKGLKRVIESLKPGGVFAINDFYYQVVPEMAFLNQINQVMGSHFMPWTKQDVQNKLQEYDWDLEYWQDIPLIPSGPCWEVYQKQAGLKEQSDYWNKVESLFIENKKHLSGFLALFKKRKISL